jgi:hypothetical protein
VEKAVKEKSSKEAKEHDDVPAKYSDCWKKMVSD